MAKSRKLFFLFFLLSTSFQIYGQSLKQYLLYLDTKDYRECFAKKGFIPENYTLKDSLLCPIKPIYLSILKQNKIDIIGQSKWLNAIAISIENEEEIKKISKLPFVINYEYLGHRNNNKQNNEQSNNSIPPLFCTSAPLNPHTQIELENGTFLHQNGFNGDGLTIAILDGGFIGTDTIDAFKDFYGKNKIKFAFDIVDNDINPYKGSVHGTNVFSILAAQKNNKLYPSAPDASYILIRTEDTYSEQKIEEFYLVRGLEMADSLGAKIVNISLGYNKFDDDSGSYSWYQISQKVSIAQKGAELAAKLGLLVVVSAGNDGDTKWKYVSFPANSEGILTVGSINNQSEISNFSSLGHFKQAEIKPNIVALGEDVFIVNEENQIDIGNGTSFSAPIISGLSACLWEAFPTLTANQIIDIIQKSSSQSLAPDRIKGYGIPNYKIAYFLAKRLTHSNANISNFEMYPSTFENDLILMVPKIENIIQVSMNSSVQQNKNIVEIKKTKQQCFDFSDEILMPKKPGFYLSRIISDEGVYYQKLIKK